MLHLSLESYYWTYTKVQCIYTTYCIVRAYTLLENLTDDAIDLLYVTKFSTIYLYLTILYVTRRFAIASSVTYTVRKFNWCRYWLAVCDEILYPFPLFDYTLRHKELCNSIISHIQRNTPKLAAQCFVSYLHGYRCGFLKIQKVPDPQHLIHIDLNILLFNFILVI